MVSSQRAMLLANLARKQAARALRRASMQPTQVYSAPDPRRLFKLTTDLDAGPATALTGNGTAQCNPGIWDQANKRWVADTAITLTIMDTIGAYWGLIGEWLWGRNSMWDGKPVVQCLSHGAADHEGKLNDGALNAGSSIAFSIYSCATGSWVDTNVDVTCYAPPRLSSGSIATGKWGRIYYDLTRPGWTLDSAEC